MYESKYAHHGVVTCSGTGEPGFDGGTGEPGFDSGTGEPGFEVIF